MLQVWYSIAMAMEEGVRNGEPVTIYEVAREAGVSTATVSRVINDLSLIHISEPTRPTT